VKSRVKELIKSFLKNVLGIQISRVRKVPPQKEKPSLKMNFVHDPAYSFMPDQSLRDQLIDELTQAADTLRSKDFFPADPKPGTRSIVKDFFDIYSSREKTDNTHGSGFHNAFWIYFITRLMDPELIVESGVWKGHTSWLISQACPDAKQYGFDISLKKLEYSLPGVTMLEQDWGSYQFPAFEPERALVFFDCHVNHAQRILEAKGKGFKHLLFDDNPPLHKLFSHIPGIPTAAMLDAGKGIDQPQIRWIWNGEEVTRAIDPLQAKQARELIKVHYTLPDVGGPTRYGGFAFLTYVQI
jgi:hypothetical protein